jgi:hypothetical protein
MKLVALFVFVCVAAGDACGDYFVGMTEVRIQPQFGRVLISREVIRGQPYVDWAVACRDALAKKGVFVDASFGESPIVNTIEGDVDGQHFKITVTTHHLRTRGMGSAIPSNHLVVSIDGTKRWDTLFGSTMNESLGWVNIHAHTHMIDHGFSEELYGDPEDYQQPDGYVFYDDWPADKCITIEDLRAKRIKPPAQDSPDVEIDVSVDSSSAISESSCCSIRLKTTSPSSS